MPVAAMMMMIVMVMLMVMVMMLTCYRLWIMCWG